MLRLNHVALGGDLCAFLFFQVSGEQFFAEVAKDVLLYVSRDLSDKVSLPFLWQNCCVVFVVMGTLHHHYVDFVNQQIKKHISQEIVTFGCFFGTRGRHSG